MHEEPESSCAVTSAQEAALPHSLLLVWWQKSTPQLSNIQQVTCLPSDVWGYRLEIFNVSNQIKLKCISSYKTTHEHSQYLCLQMSYKYCIANLVTLRAIKHIPMNTCIRCKQLSCFYFIGLMATYTSWAVHSILNEDTVGWQLFLSNVLIEHSHDIPLRLIPPSPTPILP